MILIKNGTGYAQAVDGDGIKLIHPKDEQSCGRVRHQIAPTLMAGPVVGVVIERETEKRCIQIATLDKNAHKQLEQHRRVYSTKGVCPTVCNTAGAWNQPIILIEGADQ